MKGIFITFEGSEGCGKSTQSRLLHEYLKKKGLKVVYLREPGSTKIGEKIRKILLDNKNHAMSSQCEMLLYMSSRAQAVSEIIKSSLKQGKVIICDRFIDSTLVYQGFGLGIDINFIRKVGDFVTDGIRPDLTIFLDLPVKKGLEYRTLAKDRIEKRPLGYHHRVREGYLNLAKLEHNRIKIVKVEKDKNKTQEKIRKLALDFIKNVIQGY